jgi:GWxTD domain-containing protein
MKALFCYARIAFFSAALLATSISARTSPTGLGQSSQNQNTATQTKTQTSEQATKLENELGDAYKTWLEYDVVYIITGAERNAFLTLHTNEEREAFISQFWDRRNPTPDAAENKFKQEHFRRIAYANEHFESSAPGWKTDRGRIYILWGEPDSVDTHYPSGDPCARFPENCPAMDFYPFEDWQYKYMKVSGITSMWNL